MGYIEIFYLLEIILQFFTTYKDSEHFENVYTMRLIAREYILNGQFIFHVIAFIPWTFLIDYEDPKQQELIQQLLLFKMLRLLRMLNVQDSIPEEVILGLVQNFYRGADRDERIAYDRQVLNIFRIFKSVMLTIFITYLLGLIWYRLSDNW